MAPRRLQFFSLAFFRVATRRLIPVIWLPSMSTPFRLAPSYKHIWLKHDYKCGTRSSLIMNCNRLPSRLAFSPDGSSKLHPLREAPSALEQSIFTPCKLAPLKRQSKHHHCCICKYSVTSYREFMLHYQTGEICLLLFFPNGVTERRCMQLTNMFENRVRGQQV